MTKVKIENKVSLEKEKLLLWREKTFRNLLGPKWSKKDIEKLVESEATHWDLQRLLDKGCSKKLAIKILT